jgi:hypothetical protein
VEAVDRRLLLQLLLVLPEKGCCHAAAADVGGAAADVVGWLGQLVVALCCLLRYPDTVAQEMLHLPLHDV